MSNSSQCSADPAACAMIDACHETGVNLIWDRVATMMPQCRYGVQGICCRICTMGPCRINPAGKNKVGICGATADTIAARNLVRMIAAGTAAHSDHGRGVAHTLLMAAEGKGDYKIRDEVKLRGLARELGVVEKGKPVLEVAKGVALAVSAQYGQQEGEVVFALRAPADQLKRWRENGVVPRGMDREVVDIMHRTTMGVDSEFHSILHQGVRTALADGWSGSMIATEISDVLFGTPDPIRSRVNLGVLDAKMVNILVHGHEPLLSEMIVIACQDAELIALAKSKGATGINLAGICCTANEILMRHGVPVAGNFLHQELAVATGVVDAMIVDVQCVMPGLGDLGTTFHTKFISTSKMAHFATTEHIQFEESSALESAKKIVRAGIENYPNRKGRAMVPDVRSDMVAGFTAENIATFLGGKYRATYRPLNDAVMSGRFRGAVAVVGCNNPKQCQDAGHVAIIKELLRNDVIVIATGCAAIAAAKVGLLTPEAAEEWGGEGIREVCSTVGIPPVLHMGACVDISRVLMVATNIVKEGGLGTSIVDLPVAGVAPEWMSEKAVAIGFYVIASGIYTVLGSPLPIEGGPGVLDYLTNGIEKVFGGKFAFESDPIKSARLMIDHIDAKRKALGLPPAMYAPKGEAGAREAVAV
ncbi:MAG: anaerobic carbon-monoxide dehydrogenase catalytic subunit [Candidatus Coatesbacteria bacterium]